MTVYTKLITPSRTLAILAIAPSMRGVGWFGGCTLVHDPFHLRLLDHAIDDQYQRLLGDASVRMSTC
jgi:hypothetical protein